MSAFVVARTTVHNPEKFQAYAKSVPETLAPFKGEIKSRGKLDKVIQGDNGYSTIAVIEFPDHASLDNWYESPGYQGLIALRDSCSDMQLSVYSSL